MSILGIDRIAGRIALEGELDISTVPELEEAVAAARAEGASEVIIDMSDLEFMDSTGLRFLVQSDERAREEGWRLALVRGPDPVQRVLEITRMAGRLTWVEP